MYIHIYIYLYLFTQVYIQIIHSIIYFLNIYIYIYKYRSIFLLLDIIFEIYLLRVSSNGEGLSQGPQYWQFGMARGLSREPQIDLQFQIDETILANSCLLFKANWCMWRLKHTHFQRHIADFVECIVAFKTFKLMCDVAPFAWRFGSWCWRKMSWQVERAACYLFFFG